jgi:hypothetical protein
VSLALPQRHRTYCTAQREFYGEINGCQEELVRRIMVLKLCTKYVHKQGIVSGATR